MSKARFIVAALDHHWIVSGQDGHRQAYDDRAQAIRMAVAAAHTAGRKGRKAQVLGLDGNGHLYPIWTYGLDTFVPQAEGYLTLTKSTKVGNR